MSTLLDRQKQLKNVDPFLILKEVTESLKVDLDSERYRRYQEFSKTQTGLSAVKNKEMYLAAQSKPKQSDWFTKMQQKSNSITVPDRLPSLEKLKKDIQELKQKKSGLTKEEEI